MSCSNRGLFGYSSGSCACSNCKPKPSPCAPCATLSGTCPVFETPVCPPPPEPTPIRDTASCVDVAYGEELVLNEGIPTGCDLYTPGPEVMCIPDPTVGEVVIDPTNREVKFVAGSTTDSGDVVIKYPGDCPGDAPTIVTYPVNVVQRVYPFANPDYVIVYQNTLTKIDVLANDVVGSPGQFDTDSVTVLGSVTGIGTPDEPWVLPSDATAYLNTGVTGGCTGCIAYKGPDLANFTDQFTYEVNILGVGATPTSITGTVRVKSQTRCGPVYVGPQPYCAPYQPPSC